MAKQKQDDKPELTYSSYVRMPRPADKHKIYTPALGQLYPGTTGTDKALFLSNDLDISL